MREARPLPSQLPTSARERLDAQGHGLVGVLRQQLGLAPTRGQGRLQGRHDADGGVGGVGDAEEIGES